MDCPVSPVRLDWYSYPQYAFLSYGGAQWGDTLEWEEDEDNYAISRERGCPEDFDGNQWESVSFFDPLEKHGELDVDLPEGDCAISWLSIDELVDHDYDRIVTRHGETKPLREFLTEEFIQFWKDMKAKGAERIVFSWS